MFADLIRDSALTHIRAGLSDTSAEDVRAVFGEVAAAVEVFEQMARGSVILDGFGVPDNGLGTDIDVYIDRQAADMYIKEAGEWIFKLTLRGAPSTVAGPRGLPGPASTVPGPAGKSAYELAQASGFVGTLSQYMASLQGRPGVDGANGTNGSRIRWESYAPTTESGAPGDVWIHAISAAKFAMWECHIITTSVLVEGEPDNMVSTIGTAWRLRFTSPDPTTTGGTGGTATGTVKSVNGIGPDAAGNVQISVGSGGGGSVQIEQDLSSGLTTAVPSVAAVATAVSGIGAVAGLNTTAKNTLVAAVNEIEAKVGVKLGVGAAVTFTRDREYPPIFSGTFTLDKTGAVMGTVVFCYLGVGASAPTINPADFQLITGVFQSGKENMYAFKVGANGKIQYTIFTLT